MIVKGTKQLGNFKRGINIYVPKRIVAPPAPSGIPVASTTNVIVTFGDTSSLNYARDSYPTYTYYLWQPSLEQAENISFQRLTFNFAVVNTWSLEQYSSGEDSALVIQATNPSTNSAIIPTTNWIYTIGSGPSITITAA